MDKELSELGVEQIHCEDCIHFQLTRMGRNGGLWGKCELRDDFSARNGKRKACKLCRTIDDV